MGCCGSRGKDDHIKNDVKWEYINLNDFKSASCFTILAYVYLWLMLFVSVSVYAVDTFTAVNLLAFNRWAGQIKPAIDLKYSRWIFAGCIILSFFLLIYRWLRALKVMRGGKVAKAYLDPLAVRVECLRLGEGRGWKRFLVFAELTKSRKGADYIALFAYYSFEAWLRILLAEGPRQVINGITLYAYASANFVPGGTNVAHHDNDPDSSFVQFWKNFGVLAEKDQLQMAIIIGMLWTCLIWIISFISLAVSVILYLIFLWHHIPSDAGGLSGYCRTKINRRMERIVKTKTEKALKKENEIRARQEAKAFREGTGDFKRQPTLPDVENASTASLAPLSRQTTMTTLPEYTSRPGTAPPGEERLPTLPTLPTITPSDAHPNLGPRRHLTNASDASWSSYNSNAPLMSAAGDFGHSPAERVHTPSSSVTTPWSARPGPNRSFTEFSQHSDRSFMPGPTRPGTAQSHRGPPGTYQMESIPRPGTGMSHRGRPMRQSHDSDTQPPPSVRGMTPLSAGPQSATSVYPPPVPDLQRMRTPAPNFNPYFPPVSPIPEYGGRDSPATTEGVVPRSYTPVGPPARTMTPGHALPLPLPRVQTSTPAPPSGYVAFHPDIERSASPAPMSTTREPLRHGISPATPHGKMSPTSNSSTGEMYRSYNQPYANGSTGQSSHHYQSNGSNQLQPPGPHAPPRTGSFDDILDHY